MSSHRRPAADLWPVAARLVRAMGDAAESVLVVGGLVPPTLVRGDWAPPHLGTGDIDVSVLTAPITAGVNLADIETALDQVGLTRGPGRGGWGYVGTVDGVPVLVELLCDVPGAGG
ncbi:MAG: hypothetical protein HYU28_00055 [Actinobacteria bacterium]|nr:hypothetical protein [Actinomycetota bacterium]